MATRPHDGQPLRLLTIVTQECLAIKVARQILADDALHPLAELLLQDGKPEYIWSDNEPEFTTKAVRLW